jgi:hypothetical protein
MPKRSSTNNERTGEESQLAKRLVSELTSDETNSEPLSEDIRHLIAVALGRRGGLKGGKARAEKLSPEKRTEIARLAAQKRWSKTQDE